MVNGVHSFLLQRISAIILAGYSVFLLSYILCTDLTYLEIKQLFSCSFMQYATFFALFSLLVHSWIGIWIIITDYLKSTFIRLGVQVAVVLSLIAYCLWAVDIIWSIF